MANPMRRGGSRCNQVAHRLCLAQIELPVTKRPAGKFGRPWASRCPPAQSTAPSALLDSKPNRGKAISTLSSPVKRARRVKQGDQYLIEQRTLHSIPPKMNAVGLASASSFRKENETTCRPANTNPPEDTNHRDGAHPRRSRNRANHLFSQSILKQFSKKRS